MKKMYLNSQLPLVLLLSVVFVLVGCRKDTDLIPENPTLTRSYDSEVAQEWNWFLLELERFTPGFRPPASARAFAYINLAAYESVLPGMEDNYNSFDGYFNGLSLPKAEANLEYHWPTAMNAAYARISSRFFTTASATQQFQLFQLESRFNQAFQLRVPQEVFVRSSEFGRAIADAVYNWSITDSNGHEAHLRNNDPSYIPPGGHGRWQPTFPDFTPALLPRWGNTRLFAALPSDQVADPLPHSDDQSSALYAEALEVYGMVNAILADPNSEQPGSPMHEPRWIAIFWSDDCATLTFTPAGRWVAVANQVIANENLSLDRAIEMYARVSMAISDAGVRCWGEKYRFNVERPIDYIRRVMGDPNWNSIMCYDEALGAYTTPNFPAYPSGHATFGAAAALVMEDVLNNQSYALVDRCHEGRTEFISTPRSFSSLWDMAVENAWSRIPLGVHFQMDADAGLDLGAKVANRVNNLPWRK